MREEQRDHDATEYDGDELHESLPDEDHEVARVASHDRHPPPARETPSARRARRAFETPAGSDVGLPRLNRLGKERTPIKARDLQGPQHRFRFRTQARRKSLNRGNLYSRQSIFMYQRVQREDVVRIPPERLGEDIDAVARELTRTTLEGKIGADKTLALIARDLRIGDKVRTRIVAVSLNERAPRESKIGLTMRQPALGKLDWIEEDRARAEGRVRKRKG